MEWSRGASTLARRIARANANVFERRLVRVVKEKLVAKMFCSGYGDL
jgi:hypothetical protein